MREPVSKQKSRVGSRSDNVISFDKSGEKSHARLIEQMHNSINEHLIEHFSNMLVKAPDILNRKAESCKNHDEQSRYFALLNHLQNQRDNINRSFFIALNEKLRPASQQTQDEPEELSLVSEDEMEEMVAITTMHARAMNQFGDDVNHLETRLEYLEISTSTDIEKESLSPVRFAEVFQTTLKSQTLELKDRLELFVLFDMEVISKLGALYSTLNALLIKAGVMPKIVLKSTRQEEADDEPEVSIRAAKYYDPQANPSTNFIPRSPQDISFIANRIMSGDFTPSENALNLPDSFRKPIGKRDASGKNFYERKDVMKALTRLQNNILKQGKDQSQISIDQIKRALFADMGKQNGGVITKQVNVLDERSIDFVGMMFDAITHDESISKLIKNLLLRLQIPVIKVAMSDTELFQQDNHPTREVLDLVTEAGKGINEETDRIYGALEHVVDEILEEYDIDLNSFNKAADELRNLIEAEKQITQENEIREQQKIMVAHAREIVVNEVRHISSNKAIPRNVMPLITKSLPSLMMNRYIRHGTESWQWLESVMLMKLLIKCLQPIKSSKQWETVWNNHLGLVEAVHDELYTSKQDRKTIDEQVDELKTTFLEILDAYGYKLVEETRVSTTTMFEDEGVAIEKSQPENDVPAENDPAENEDAEKLPVTHLEEIARLAQDKLSQLPTMVHPGVWFEIYNGEDKAVRRLKLSVILTEVAKLVFVDRKGLKVIEKDAADFAAELSGNKSRFIADHSTFQHALGQVIHSMAA